MALRTREEIKNWLKQNREKKQKQLTNEKNRIKKQKEEDRIRKRKHQQWLNKLKKEEEKKLIVENTIIICSIYNNKYVERFPSDEDLYNTREEIMEAEKRYEGKINWDKFNQLVEKTKIEIKNMLK